ncbi:MAG: NusG domain II-containing protein [Clostridia bacterium]|nr:NusG domain II-containing protein [Clostridia bacterium]
MKSRFKNDIMLVSIILVVALILFLFFKFSLKTGDMVVISINGETAFKLPLNTDTEKTVKSELGENVILIKGGIAQIISADCRDKICVHHEAISKSGETIVCLPHKLVVVINGEEET